MKKPNLLRIKTINATWCDKDIVMLHACFQLLTDFIEQENPFETTDWEHTEEKKTVKKEIDFLYNWWKELLIKKEKDEWNSMNNKIQYEEENEMLIRLIKIRGHLWD
jgi:hypothetical protein